MEFARVRPFEIGQLTNFGHVVAVVSTTNKIRQNVGNVDHVKGKHVSTGTKRVVENSGPFGCFKIEQLSLDVATFVVFDIIWLVRANSQKPV